MDLTAAQTQGGSAGAATGAMDSGDWRDELQANSRGRIVNRIMEMLEMHIPVHGQDGVQELRKVAVRFEEKLYNAATSQQDYLRKISLEILILDTKYQNPMTNLTAAQTQGDDEGDAGAAAGAMDSGDWRTQLRPGSRGRIVNKIMEDIKRRIPVLEQDREQELMKVIVTFEERVYNIATSQQDYLRKMSLEVLKLDVEYQNTASSGQNAHGPGDRDEEQAAEEEDGDVSKKDVVEEVVVKKEQNNVVGHKENVKVGENEVILYLLFCLLIYFLSCKPFLLKMEEKKCHCTTYLFVVSDLN